MLISIRFDPAIHVKFESDINILRLTPSAPHRGHREEVASLQRKE